MKVGRNDPCPCGSGQKYKRCCIDRDEAMERERRTVEVAPDLVAGDRAVEQHTWTALANSLEAVMTKDRVGLSRLLDDFADLLRTEALADLRFQDADFTNAVEASLCVLGRARGARARRRLFRRAMEELADRRTICAFRDRLGRAIKSAPLNPLARDAVAAAFVCLAPVLEKRALPAIKSPTIEIIFNVQLDRWLQQRRFVAGEVGEAVERLSTVDA